MKGGGECRPSIFSLIFKKKLKNLEKGEYFLPGVLTFPAPIERLTLEKNYIGLGIDLVRLFAI